VYIRAAKYPETASPAYHPHTCRLMMKHLPKALLLALVVGAPVMAQTTKKPPAKAPEIEVDYLKCDAMEKAKKRLESSVLIKVATNQAEMEALMATRRGTNSEQIRAQLDARENTYSLLRQGIGHEFAVEEMKMVQKVEADMRKAKCP